MVWLIGLCGIAALFIVLPLWRKRTHQPDVDRGELLRLLHAQRSAEVSEQAEPELRGALADEMDSVLLAEHAELDGAGVAPNAQAAPGSQASGRMYWLLLAVVPLLAWLVYVQVTDTGLQEIRGAEVVLTLSSQEQQAEIQRWQEKLAKRVAVAPQDSKSWYLLGHTFLKLSNYGAAAEAFATTDQLVEDDLTVQIYWLQSRYLAARGVLDDVSLKLAEDILVQQPNQPMVLEILALHAFAQDDKAKAVELLNRAMSGTRDAMQRASFGRAIEQIRSGMPNPPPGVSVSVRVAEEHIDRIPHAGSVFVIARPVGGGMPFAVVRRPAILMPLQVRLDDLVSMSGTRKLSDAVEFEVVVRLSASGNAMPADGDWQWVSAPQNLSQAIVSQPPRAEDPQATQEHKSNADSLLQVVLSPPDEGAATE